MYSTVPANWVRGGRRFLYLGVQLADMAMRHSKKTVNIYPLEEKVNS